MAGKLFHHIIKTQSIEAYQLLLYGKVSLISDMPNPNAPTNTGARASGRIPVAFRATNDSVGILGEDVDVGDDYNAIVQETLDKEITEKTRKNYRNRLKKIIDYWREHCNEYYQQGVRQVPTDELMVYRRCTLPYTVILSIKTITTCWYRKQGDRDG